MNSLLLILLLLVLFILQGWIFRKYSLRGLQYTRTFSKSRAFVGQPLELIEVIRNKKPLPLPWLRIESRLSTALVFGNHTASTQEIHSVSSANSASYHRSVFFLGPYSQVTRRHHVTPLRRGVYSARSASLTCGDLFGVASAQKELDLGAELIVYPRLPSEDSVTLPSSHAQGDVTVQRWISPDPFLIGGIRPYRDGDPLRSVHWAATARMNTLEVKAPEYTADPQVFVVLNVQLQENQWGDLMDYEQDVLEEAISLSAGLCLSALKNGCAAGFAANAPLDENKTITLLPPMRHAERDTELLEAMARLRILRIHDITAVLDELLPYTGLDIVLLSAYITPGMEERIENLRRRDNTVSVMEIGNPHK